MSFLNFDWTKLFEKIVDVVHKAEELYRKKTGAEKRKFAINCINALVDVPYVPERIEGWIIGLCVDLVVYLYNKWFGHDWIKKVEVKDE